MGSASFAYRLRAGGLVGTAGGPVITVIAQFDKVSILMDIRTK
jgi:hypothetical protein